MTMKQPSIAYSITVRAQHPNRVGMLGQITSAIGEVGGNIGDQKAAGAFFVPEGPFILPIHRGVILRESRSS